MLLISTHTPLAGRDGDRRVNCSGHVRISTHTPLAGRDTHWTALSEAYCKFLLTRPLRDVTLYLISELKSIEISTHTPLAGRDALSIRVMPELFHFYSHAPCGT